jgi:hypothetical protein
MEIPMELKRRADVIKTEKKKRRFRVIRNLAAIVLILFFSGSGAVYLNFNPGLVTFFLLLLVGSMVVFIVYFVGTVLTKLQDPLSPMEKSFELLYSTLDKD